MIDRTARLRAGLPNPPPLSDEVMAFYTDLAQAYRQLAAEQGHPLTEAQRIAYTLDYLAGPE